MHTTARALLAPQSRRLWRLLLAVMVAVVSWLAFMPSSTPDMIEHLDKVKHVSAFTALALVAVLAWEPGRRTEVAVGLALLAYGLFIELVQSQLPTRSASAADWLADAIGICLGLALSRLLRRRLREISPPPPG